MITFKCPQCNATLSAPDGASSRKARCNRCQQSIVVPDQEHGKTAEANSQEQTVTSHDTALDAFLQAQSDAETSSISTTGSVERLNMEPAGKCYSSESDAERRLDSQIASKQQVMSWTLIVLGGVVGVLGVIITVLAFLIRPDGVPDRPKVFPDGVEKAEVAGEHHDDDTDAVYIQENVNSAAQFQFTFRRVESLDGDWRTMNAMFSAGNHQGRCEAVGDTGIKSVYRMETGEGKFDTGERPCDIKARCSLNERLPAGQYDASITLDIESPQSTINLGPGEFFAFRVEATTLSKTFTLYVLTERQLKYLKAKQKQESAAELLPAGLLAILLGLAVGLSGFYFRKYGGKIMRILHYDVFKVGRN